LLQLAGGCAVKAVVDFAGIDEVGAFAPAEIDAVELFLLQREAGDRQGISAPGAMNPRRAE
jgi:hypothetical protein